MKCYICPDALYFPDIKSSTEFITTNQTQQINGKDRLEIVMPDNSETKTFSCIEADSNKL